MNIKTEELDTGIKLTATIPMFEEKELETFDNNIHNIAKEYCEMHLKEKEQILTQRLIKMLEDENKKQKEVLDKAIEYIKEATKYPRGMGLELLDEIYADNIIDILQGDNK